MTLTADQQYALRESAQRVDSAKSEFDTAKAQRESLIAHVASQGGTYREIAAESGLSYQRVHQLLTGEKPPTMPYAVDRLYHCERCGAKPGEPCIDEKGKSRGISVHIQRANRAYHVFMEDIEPLADEPGRMTPLYQAQDRAFPQFANSPDSGFRSEGPIYTDLAEAEKLAATLRDGHVRRWNGHEWIRF